MWEISAEDTVTMSAKRRIMRNVMSNSTVYYLGYNMDNTKKLSGRGAVFLPINCYFFWTKHPENSLDLMFSLSGEMKDANRLQ